MSQQSSAYHHFVQLISILINLYQFQLKLLLLVCCCVVFYTIGSRCARQPLRSLHSKLSKAIISRQQRHQTLSLSTKLYKLVILLSVMAMVSLLLFVLDQVSSILPILCWILTVVVVVWWRVLVQNLKKQIPVDKIVTELVGVLGSKANNALEVQLCRQRLLQRAKTQTNICSKEECKAERQNLRVKRKAILTLVDSVLMFQWCTQCRARPPFDQLIGYERRVFQGVEDVQSKNRYLIEEIQSMEEWLRKVGPCNCSKLYWEMSQREIKLFKQIEKEVSSSKHISGSKDSSGRKDKNNDSQKK